jgi:SAM-dependent methyltransferase
VGLPEFNPERPVTERMKREPQYWDSVARYVTPKGSIKANIHKMEQIAPRVMRAGSHIGQRVLEVGIGCGIIAAVMNVLILGKWKYTGTDMSPIFVQRAIEGFHFDIKQTDVTCLPGEAAEYTRVWCFDSLEHVHPEDREKGYQEIARVLAQKGLLLINMPLSEDQFHDPEFDHPFGMPDFDQIVKAGFKLRSYEAYLAFYPELTRPSAFVVFERK